MNIRSVNCVSFSNRKNNMTKSSNISANKKQSFGYLLSPDQQAALSFLAKVNHSVSEFFAPKMLKACSNPTSKIAKIESDKILDKFLYIANRSGFTPPTKQQNKIIML